jgi:hypothetical protein
MNLAEHKLNSLLCECLHDKGVMRQFSPYCVYGKMIQFSSMRTKKCKSGGSFLIVI